MNRRSFLWTLTAVTVAPLIAKAVPPPDGEFKHVYDAVYAPLKPHPAWYIQTPDGTVWWAGPDAPSAIQTQARIWAQP